jgi:uncharacterized protein (UPF0548 family)
MTTDDIEKLEQRKREEVDDLSSGDCRLLCGWRVLLRMLVIGRGENTNP